MLMPRAAPKCSAPSRGLAALTVVMVLFLIMAMVAAYTNRNLIFEQRTSANTYRAERSLAAAESGVDWTLSMLNGGRIDKECKPSADDADDDYRSRYLSVDADGRYSIVGAPEETYSGCVNVAGALTCGCPTPAKPDFSVTSTAEPAGNAFRVTMARVGAVSREGMVTLDVRGCGTPGLNEENCASNGTTAKVDGVARIVLALGVVRALPAAPSAALTTAARLVAGGNELRITNTDAQTGFTVHTGQAITATGTNHFVVPAGSSGSGLIEADTALANLAPADKAQRATENDKMFIGTFGIDAPTYRRQQAVVRTDCAKGCDSTPLDNMLQRFPGRAFWFDGDLTIDKKSASATIGTAARPALVIVAGKLTVGPGAPPMTGLVYASEVEWNAPAATVRGAILSVGDFIANERTTITYDADVLKTIVNTYGTFVRVPGSWNRPTF